MRKQKFSRRDVLKGSTALAVGTVFAEPVRAAAPPAEAITPALIEAAKKEGKCTFYTAMDLQFAEKLGKEFEAKYPRHRRARRALRRRARVHPHRPGVFEQRPCRRRGQHRRPVALHRLEAATAGSRPICPRRSRKHYDKALLRPRRLRGGDPRAGVAVRHQHRPGEDGGRAEELRRPARSEMGGQDGQGASGLQRHHHERDLPDRPRSRLGVFREARQAAHHAGAVGDRHAEEDRARRARHHDRRRGLSGDPRQGGRQAGRRRSIRRRARRSRPARARCSRPRPIRTRRGCSSTGCTAARASRS